MSPIQSNDLHKNIYEINSLQVKIKELESKLKEKDQTIEFYKRQSYKAENKEESILQQVIYIFI